MKLEGVLTMEEEKRNFELDVITRLTKIETLLEDFKGVETKCNEAYMLSNDNKKRLDKMEDNNRWLFRTVIGSVVTGLIAIALNFIK